MTGDPTAAQPAPPSQANAYMMQTYLTYVLPKAPDLTLIWFRSPDSPEHRHGPGSPTYHDALQEPGPHARQLQASLKTRGWDKTTDIIVVSDHGHSSVSGNTTLFPLRTIAVGRHGFGRSERLVGVGRRAARRPDGEGAHADSRTCTTAPAACSCRR